jgi:hypothetical protein
MTQKKRDSKKKKLERLLTKRPSKSIHESDLLALEYHRLHEAQKFVVAAAYTDPDETLQIEFGELLPDNTSFTDFQRKVLQRLQSRNKSTRSRALNKLWEKVLGEWGMEKDLIFLHSKTVLILIRALQSETVVGNQALLIKALGRVHTRGFWWVAIYEAITPFFKSHEKELVNSAVMATQHMRHDDRRWNNVFPLIKKCKNAQMMSIFGSHCRHVPSSLKSDLVEVLLEKYNIVRGHRCKRSVVYAIWLVATNKKLSQRVATALEWKESELAEHATVCNQCEPNSVLEKEISRTLE